MTSILILRILLLSLVEGVFKRLIFMPLVISIASAILDGYMSCIGQDETSVPSTSIY